MSRIRTVPASVVVATTLVLAACGGLQRPATTEQPSTVTYALLEEQLIGSYAVRLWHPSQGLYDSATISRPGQPEIQVEAVESIGSLPASDVTGDGYPDVMFETYDGGSHCCWGTVVYSLGPVPTKVLDVSSAAYYYASTGRGSFRDLDSDGIYEFITHDPVLYSPCSQPRVKVILQYEPGHGYVGASPRFAALYAEDIAAHTRQAEEQINLSKEGYKCGVYPVVMDYLYSGQPDRAWEELNRLYLAPDVEVFRRQLEHSASRGRFFVATEVP